MGKHEVGQFRLLGKEVEQDDTKTISVRCQATTEKLTKITISHPPNEERQATDEEQQSLMSVTGSASWVTRSCRPGSAVITSELQSAVRAPLVSDLVKANKLVDKLQATSNKGLTFRPGLRWEEVCVVAVSNASHGGNDEWLDEWQVCEPFRP